MLNSRIEWCDSTYNPVTGCLHGCEYCYAQGMVKRFGRNYPDNSDYAFRDKGLHRAETRFDDTPYPFGFEPTFHAYRLNEYVNKKGRNIFVCSMADLFGEWVPDEWIEEVFESCMKAPQHNYLFLTKNTDRYIKLESGQKLPRGDNFWFGTSITKQSDEYTLFPENYNWFLSMEPLLEDLGKRNPDLPNPDWIIVGAETGNRKGRVVPKKEWIGNIVASCREAGIPIFMKSSLSDIWGEPLIQEFPEGLRGKE